MIVRVNTTSNKMVTSITDVAISVTSSTCISFTEAQRSRTSLIKAMQWTMMGVGTVHVILYIMCNITGTVCTT